MRARTRENRATRSSTLLTTASFSRETRTSFSESRSRNNDATRFCDAFSANTHPSCEHRREYATRNDGSFRRIHSRTAASVPPSTTRHTTPNPSSRAHAHACCTSGHASNRCWIASRDHRTPFTFTTPLSAARPVTTTTPSHSSQQSPVRKTAMGACSLHTPLQRMGPRTTRQPSSTLYKQPGMGDPTGTAGVCAATEQSKQKQSPEVSEAICEIAPTSHNRRTR